MKCDNCGKGIMIGHNVSHAKNRTRKIFKPNLHVSRVMFEGRLKRMKLCTKCLRRLKSKDLKESTSAKASADKEVSSIAPVAAGLV
jgi:large subunit ribosomal protein L28